MKRKRQIAHTSSYLQIRSVIYTNPQVIYKSNRKRQIAHIYVKGVGYLTLTVKQPQSDFKSIPVN